MKNSELIELLKQLPPDLEVYDWNSYPIEAPIVKTLEFWATGPDVEEKTVVYFP